jgi:hypothetical protein
MTNQKITEVCFPLMEREFDINETMKVLTYDSSIFWSWGVSKRLNINDKGLLLDVNGHHHKGSVLITLGWNDTYCVYIINNRGKILNEYKEVYFDVLTEMIDNRIERVKDYVF